MSRFYKVIYGKGYEACFTRKDLAIKYAKQITPKRNEAAARIVLYDQGEEIAHFNSKGEVTYSFDGRGVILGKERKA